MGKDLYAMLDLRVAGDEKDIFRLFQLNLVWISQFKLNWTLTKWIPSEIFMGAKCGKQPLILSVEVDRITEKGLSFYPHQLFFQYQGL